MIFSNGCPPCEATKPIWDQLKSSFAHNKDAVIARIVSSDFSKLQNAGTEPNGVPTFRYLHNKKVEEFSKGRILDVFTNWIHSKSSKSSKTKKGGRKWSLKYKRSINCKRPRGFSQKQYCNKKTRRRK
jgi:thiol-disulfide isomerase/thioredoxin